MSGKSPIMTDVAALRIRAKKGLDDGAVTDGYSADRKVVLRLLNEALATEIVCVLRYRHHHFMVEGIHAQSIAEEFLQHAIEEQGHADQIARRIVQLGGTPDFNPQTLLSRSHSEYVEGKTVTEMLQADLVAERIAIDSYREMARYLGSDDPTSRRMIEDILAVEEQHADELATLLRGSAASTG